MVALGEELSTLQGWKRPGGSATRPWQRQPRSAVSYSGRISISLGPGIGLWQRWPLAPGHCLGLVLPPLQPEVWDLLFSAERW